MVVVVSGLPQKSFFRDRMSTIIIPSPKGAPGALVESIDSIEGDKTTFHFYCVEDCRIATCGNPHDFISMGASLVMFDQSMVDVNQIYYSL